MRAAPHPRVASNHGAPSAHRGRVAGRGAGRAPSAERAEPTPAAPHHQLRTFFPARCRRTTGDEGRKAPWARCPPNPAWTSCANARRTSHAPKASNSPKRSSGSPGTTVSRAGRNCRRTSAASPSTAKRCSTRTTRTSTTTPSARSACSPRPRTRRPARASRSNAGSSPSPGTAPSWSSPASTVLFPGAHSASTSSRLWTVASRSRGRTGRSKPAISRRWKRS